MAHPYNSIYYLMPTIVWTTVYSMYMVDASTCWEFLNNAEAHAALRRVITDRWCIKDGMKLET
jgi:hypothetical protein